MNMYEGSLLSEVLLDGAWPGDCVFKISQDVHHCSQSYHI